MKTQEWIEAYIASLPAPKRSDMQALHNTIQRMAPASELRFLDGKDATGKVVTNPNIGYGTQILKQAGGKAKEFYRVGISGNSTGISVYIMGLADKDHLVRAYGKRIGKASVTGYCIKFKALKDVDMAVLEAAIRERLEAAE